MYFLASLNHIRFYLSRASFGAVMRAFVTSRPDYCIFFFLFPSASTLRLLHLVQNQVPHLRYRCKSTRILSNFHWFPIKFCTQLKIRHFTDPLLLNITVHLLIITDSITVFQANHNLRSAPPLLFSSQLQPSQLQLKK